MTLETLSHKLLMNTTLPSNQWWINQQLQANLCQTMIVFHPFHGLGSEYNAFVKSINSRPDEPTIEEVHSLLLSSDMRLQRLNSMDQIQFAQANLAAQGNRKFRKQIKTKVDFCLLVHSSLFIIIDLSINLSLVSQEKPQGPPMQQKWHKLGGTNQSGEKTVSNMWKMWLNASQLP